MSKEEKPKVGLRVKCISGCYEGEIGTIEYCNTCCRKYRVEWDNIGNNTSLMDLKKIGCKLEIIGRSQN